MFLVIRSTEKVCTISQRSSSTQIIPHAVIFIHISLNSWWLVLGLLNSWWLVPGRELIINSWYLVFGNCEFMVRALGRGPYPPPHYTYTTTGPWPWSLGLGPFSLLWNKKREGPKAKWPWPQERVLQHIVSRYQAQARVQAQGFLQEFASRGESWKGKSEVRVV